MKPQLQLPEFLMTPHPLANFEIQNCDQNGRKSNGVYS